MSKKVKEFTPCGCYNCTDATIKNYGRTIPSKFYNYTEDDLYFGMELEVGIPEINSAKLAKLAKYVKQLFGHLVELKWDGSIRDYGFEMTFQPVSAKSFKQFVNTNRFSKLANAGLKAYDLRRRGISSGVHLHMSRCAFTPLMIVKLCEFFRLNKRFIDRIANRSNSMYADYYNDAFHKDNFIHYAKGYRNSHSERYMPLNFEAKDTIEVRVFQGTLNTDRLNSYIEFLAALYQFIKVAPLDTTNEYEGLEFRKFAQFVDANKTEYPYLHSLNVVQESIGGSN